MNVEQRQLPTVLPSNTMLLWSAYTVCCLWFSKVNWIYRLGKGALQSNAETCPDVKNVCELEIRARAWMRVESTGRDKDRFVRPWKVERELFLSFVPCTVLSLCSRALMNEHSRDLRNPGGVPGSILIQPPTTFKPKFRTGPNCLIV